MKKIALILAFAGTLIIALPGCKKDKDNSDPGIAGKWFLKKTTEIYYENGVKTEEETRTDFNDSFYSEFGKDGTGISGFHYGEDGYITGTYNFTYNYNYTDKKMSVTSVSDQTTEEYTIKTLTPEQLVLFSDITDDLGNNVTARETLEITFSR